MALQVAVLRHAEGVGRRTPIAPGTAETCPPVDEDLSKGPECGTPRSLRAKAALAPGVIFGKKRVIIVKMRRPRASEPQIAQLPGSLVSRRFHTGENTATIRLIRLG